MLASGVVFSAILEAARTARRRPCFSAVVLGLPREALHRLPRSRQAAPDFSPCTTISKSLRQPAPFASTPALLSRVTPGCSRWPSPRRPAPRPGASPASRTIASARPSPRIPGHDFHQRGRQDLFSPDQQATLRPARGHGDRRRSVYRTSQVKRWVISTAARTKRPHPNWCPTSQRPACWRQRRRRHHANATTTSVRERSAKCLEARRATSGGCIAVDMQRPALRRAPESGTQNAAMRGSRASGLHSARDNRR